MPKHIFSRCLCGVLVISVQVKRESFQGLANIPRNKDDPLLANFDGRRTVCMLQPQKDSKIFMFHAARDLAVTQIVL